MVGQPLQENNSHHAETTNDPVTLMTKVPNGKLLSQDPSVRHEASLSQRASQ